MTPRPDENLYARVLGAAWHELAPAVQAVHLPGWERRGEFCVVHGGGRIARMLAGWSGLPRVAECVGTVLRIVEERGRQRWERAFDGKPMVTTQWAGEPGCLMERVGAWELCFRLRVGDGALFYEQTRARFCLGRLRLWLPVAPTVTASEKAEGEGKVRVSVEVRLPVLGRLIAYDGWLGVEGPGS